MNNQQSLDSLIKLIEDSKGNPINVAKTVLDNRYSTEVLNDALLYSIDKSREYWIIFLIQIGADVNCYDDEPLFRALAKLDYKNIYNYYYTLEILLKAGANPNARDGEAVIYLINQSNTIYSSKISRGIAILLKNNYDVTVNDNAAVVLAADKKLWHIVLQLVKSGADIHARNNYVLNLLGDGKNNFLYKSIINPENLPGYVIKIKDKKILISDKPVYTVVTNDNINITCNQMNNFEDNYPLGIISGSQIPKKRLVALAKISELKQWSPGKNINTQCFNADWLYETWFRSKEEVTNPANKEPVDGAAVLYVKKLVEGEPNLSDEDENDYYQVNLHPQGNSYPRVITPPKVISPRKFKTPPQVNLISETATFNLNDVYKYTEKYMDDWLATFGLKYYTLAEKRYMVISKLIEHNLFNNGDKFLIIRNIKNFLTLLIQSPTANILREYLVDYTR